MDVETLARVQFAFTIAFHYIYPPLSIGLGLVMTIMEGMYLKTKDAIYEKIAKFYTKIFALIFGLGVATGIVMEFEFGTNWATYSKYVGDIFGSALAAEGIFAFALESGFLGILLFGWNRVGPKMHFFSTLMVTLGSMFSAVWIVVANSWQQTPTGYKVVGEGMNARAEITDFWEMVFNPSAIDRVLHVWLGAFLAGAFLVLSINAYYIKKGKYVELSKKSFKPTLIIAAICSLLQLGVGHRSAQIVAQYQPAKLAAMEGHYKKNAPANLYLFGYVDKQKERTIGVSIPNGLSFLVYGNFTTPIKALNEFPVKDRPNAPGAVFQTYHIMVAIGVFLIAISLYACYLLFWKKSLFEKKWLMWLFIWSVLLPQIANQVGWFTAEMGRQPWVVYHLLRTSDALSKMVTANQVLFSLILFTFIYALLFFLFIYLLSRKIKNGPYSKTNIDHSPMHKAMVE